MATERVESSISDARIGGDAATVRAQMAAGDPKHVFLSAHQVPDAVPRPAFYRARLARFRSLSHLTVEVEAAREGLAMAEVRNGLSA